jgi:hypothetical protein
MLMDPDQFAIDENIFEIRIVAEGLENALPDTLLRPPPEACVDGEPLAERFRQSRHGEPVRAIQRTASTKSRLSRPLQPGSPTLPESSGAIRSHWASLNINRIKADLQFSALNQFSTNLGILFVNRL